MCLLIDVVLAFKSFIFVFASLCEMTTSPSIVLSHVHFQYFIYQKFYDQVTMHTCIYFIPTPPIHRYLHEPLTAPEAGVTSHAHMRANTCLSRVAGSIGEALEGLVSLTHLDLSHNQLSGRCTPLDACCRTYCVRMIVFVTLP